MHIVFCNRASCHLCADLLSRSGRCVLFCGYLQPCISHCRIRNENLRTWFPVFRSQYFCCGSDDGIRKGAVFRFDHISAFICIAAFVPDGATAEVRLNRRMACCPCGRSSDITRFCMVSASSATVGRHYNSSLFAAIALLYAWRLQKISSHTSNA